jgi:hypothetical protein
MPGEGTMPNRTHGAIASTLTPVINAIRKLVPAVSPRCDPRVRPARPGHRLPRNSAERIAVAIVDAEHDVPFSVLVARVAEELYRSSLRTDMCGAELRLFGAWLFYPEVRRALVAGNGSLWHLEDQPSLEPLTGLYH